MPTCQKCGSHFPNRITVDGKAINTAGRKFCLECSPLGQRNRIDLTKEQRRGPPTIQGLKTCLHCGRTLDIQSHFYAQWNGKPMSWCKECVNQRTKDRKRANKQKAVEYKGGKCQRCGYSKCLSALEFHHVDGEAKEEILSVLARRTFDKMKPELDKCILVCVNCHREIHDEENSMQVSRSQ